MEATTDALTLTDSVPGLDPLVAAAVDEYRAMDSDERRTWRARLDPMVVVPRVSLDGDATGVYDVFRPDLVRDTDDALVPSFNHYIVDLPGRDCDCPFAREREEPCKHLLRVSLAVDEMPLPGPHRHADHYWDWLAGVLEACERRDDLRPMVEAARRTLASEFVEARE